MQWFKRWRKKQRTNNTWLYRTYAFWRRHLRPDLDKFGRFEHAYHEHVTKPLAAFAEYGVLPIKQATYYEFGVGKGESLIGLALAGMGRIIATDVKRLWSGADLVKLLADYQKYALRLGITYPSDVVLPGADDAIDIFLHDHFRIAYRAPYSALHTDLPSGSVDYLGSFYVFEHLPLSELPAIINECYRLLKNGGVFYCTIDYHDHSISEHQKPNPHYPRNVYGYLQYPPAIWDDNEFWRNSWTDDYQNRLRTKDYLRLFTDAGFRVLAMNMVNDLPLKKRQREFAKIKVDPYFAHYTTAELLVEGCTFILTKPTHE